MARHFYSALAVTKGKVGGGEFSDETVKDCSLRVLMLKVAVKPNALMKETEAHVVVHVSEGLRHRRHVTVPRGDPRKPVSFDEILSKFKSLNGKTFSGERIEGIANTVQNLDELTYIASLVDLCRRPDRLTA